ncbi:MAG: hypothetical protein ACLFUZ_02400 [Candidatus Micrarchaeia archaeon]
MAECAGGKIKMIQEILKGVILPVSKKYVEVMVEEVTERVETKVDEITMRSTYMVKELIPPILYSTLFFGAGMLILIIGASAYVDSLLMVEGAGYVLGGLVLILIGGYYKMEMDKAVMKIKRL